MPIVVIINANQSISLLLETVLKRARYQVFVAATGLEGIEAVQVIQPHVVIVDDYLPNLSPQEVCLRLKSDPHTRHIPIVLSTTAMINDPLEYAQQNGADGILRKPFRTDDVVVTLTGMLGS